tara:strand:- start:1351 stop:1500 length:150 start_codon:yes stop_codon:yes gene_type:complete
MVAREPWSIGRLRSSYALLDVLPSQSKLEEQKDTLSSSSTGVIDATKEF